MTKDNTIVMASEVGVYDTDPSNIKLKSRLKPGRMLLVDTKEKLFIRDEAIKLDMARSRPYATWLHELVTMDDLRAAHTGPLPTWESGVNKLENGRLNGNGYNGDIKENGTTLATK